MYHHRTYQPTLNQLVNACVNSGYICTILYVIRDGYRVFGHTQQAQEDNGPWYHPGIGGSQLSLLQTHLHAYDGIVRSLSQT